MRFHLAHELLPLAASYFAKIQFVLVAGVTETRLPSTPSSTHHQRGAAFIRTEHQSTVASVLRRDGIFKSLAKSFSFVDKLTFTANFVIWCQLVEEIIFFIHNSHRIRLWTMIRFLKIEFMKS